MKAELLAPCCYWLAIPMDEVEEIIPRYLDGDDAQSLLAWLRQVREENGIGREGL